MLFDASMSVAKYEKLSEPGILPGSRVPIRITEAALIRQKDKDFIAMEDEKGRVNVCCVDPRFRHMFINDESLEKALNQWWIEFGKSGEGL